MLFFLQPLWAWLAYGKKPCWLFGHEWLITSIRDDGGIRRWADQWHCSNCKARKPYKA